MSTDLPVFAHTFPTLAVPERGSADRSHAQGHAAGYAAGIRAAVEELRQSAAAHQAERTAFQQRERARIDQAVRGLEAAALAFVEKVATVHAASEALVHSAALDLAEAVVGAQLRSGDAAQLALARALQNVDPGDVRRVRLSAADWASLDENARSTIGVVVIADASLASGDAMVDLADGYLDARIGSALARARQALEAPA
ncbi:FliH/SctL family protein [Arthrobacter sp. H20]|uniref:FliH/SctL family protein n=1 Tax=Arthrobacter sp. H20 TaxID=1267981 RepID=UPI0004BA7054|nr:FliH/SctL family protein [Arthrobacter sp. H20]